MISNNAIEIKIEDGVVLGIFLDGASIDFNVAKDCIRIRLLLQDKKIMPLLLDIRNLKELSKPARDLLASSEGLKAISAGALLTDKSFFLHTLGSIFFRLSKPKIPHKMFHDRKQAIAWLKKFKK